MELDRESLMVEAETKLKGDRGRVANPVWALDFSG